MYFPDGVNWKFSIFLIAVILVKTVTSDKTRPGDQNLIVLLYSGFNGHIISPEMTPNIVELSKTGMLADLGVSWPTLPRSSQFTIATGQYPEVHGVLFDEYFDERTKKRESESFNFYHYKKNILPFWITNEYFGGISGCIMWHGSNYTYKDQTCTYLKKYKSNTNLEKLIDLALGWLKKDNNAANLVFLHWDQPGLWGRVFGSESKEYRLKVAELDRGIGYIHEKLNKTGLMKNTNVLHLSDHGMVNVQVKNFLPLNLTHARVYGNAACLQYVPFLNATANETRFEIAYNLNKTEHNFTLFFKQTLPDYFHAENPRMGHYIFLAKEGFAFNITMERKMEEYRRRYNRSNYNAPGSWYGISGYQNILPSMKGFYLAVGPAFNKSDVTEFHAVDLIFQFAAVLNIPYTPGFTDCGYLFKFCTGLIVINFWNLRMLS